MRHMYRICHAAIARSRWNILLSQLGSWAQVKWTLRTGIKILVIFSETLQFPHSNHRGKSQEGSIGARDSQRSIYLKYCWIYFYAFCYSLKLAGSANPTRLTFWSEEMRPWFWFRQSYQQIYQKMKNINENIPQNLSLFITGILRYVTR